MRDYETSVRLHIGPTLTSAKGAGVLHDDLAILADHDPVAIGMHLNRAAECLGRSPSPTW